MQYHHLARQVGNAVRLAEVVQVLLRHGFADLLRRVGLHRTPRRVAGRFRRVKAPPIPPETLGERVRRALTELGPTFVKFGQILSTRPDLVGKDLSDALQHLQERVPPVPFEQVEPVLREAFRRPVEDCFVEFDREPVAAASLSQVYRGRLKTGEEVAVKVQRPGIAGVIRSDLNLMRGIAAWLEEHVEDLQWADPVGVVDEFARSIRRELDFSIEARLIERFRHNFQEDARVFVPRTYQELCSSQVLVMDWIAGARVDALNAYEELGSNPVFVARAGSEILLAQIFEHHLFHADPHPGNIRVLPNNRIAFLDYGMVGHIGEADVTALTQLLRAIVEQDADTCVAALLGFTTEGDVSEPQSFTHEVGDFITLEAEALVSTGNLGRIIERVIELLRRNGLELAPRYSLLLKTLATIESTGHQLDPRLDLLPTVRRHVERLMRERYAPARLAKEVQRDLENVIQIARSAPGELQTLLRMLRKGRLQVQLNHERLNHLVNITDRASNRVAFALVCGSLIIGSSWLIATEAAPRNLGLGGYIVAGLLGLALAFSILRSKNY